MRQVRIKRDLGSGYGVLMDEDHTHVHERRSDKPRHKAPCYPLRFPSGREQGATYGFLTGGLNPPVRAAV
jgi:hypothetical protein